MQNVILTQLSTTEIRELFREELKQFFEENSIRQKEETEQPKIVDLNGLLAARPIVGTRSTIYKKISRGIIPHSKRGKKVYFSLDDIDAWLLSNKVGTVDELKENLQNHLTKNRK